MNELAYLQSNRVFSTGLISVFGSVNAIALFGIGSSLETNANLAFLSINLLINHAEAHRST